MLVEGLALELGDLEFKGGGLTRTISAGESAGAPRRAWVANIYLIINLLIA
jgi:hypothetical protein